MAISLFLYFSISIYILLVSYVLWSAVFLGRIQNNTKKRKKEKKVGCERNGRRND